jgi:large subunit ribosomal protein L10
MSRLEKECLVSDVRADLLDRAIVIIAKQRGITVAQSTQLRRDMRSVNAKLRVLKNTLLRVAVTGTALEGITKFLEGPVVLAYSSDPVSTAKVVSKFVDDHEERLQIVGGWMSGQILDAQSVQVLAKLPSLEELMAKMLGLITAPAIKVVRTIKEPLSLIARVVALKP